VLVTFQSENLDVKKLFDDLRMKPLASGLANVKLDVQGTLAQLRGRLDLQMRELRSTDYPKLEPAAFDLAADLGAELRIAPSGFLFSATHSHDSPDFIGGWGGVPQWYMDQVTDAMRQSVREAYANRRPARLEMGEKLTRNLNHERRNVYWSAEDPTVNWFRAIDRSGAVTGAYDKMLVRLSGADFPLRLLSPYEWFPEEVYQSCQKVIREKWSTWTD